MLDPKCKDKLAKGYASIGAIAYKIALNILKGKDAYLTQQELYQKGIKIRQVMKVLLRHVTFEGDVPTLWNITEDQVNSLLRYLDRIADLDKIPGVPSVLPTPKPIVFNQGPPGPAGQDGQNGSDANIVVRAKAGDAETTVEESVIAGVKTYDISFTPYTAPELTVSIQGTKTYEKGVVVADKVVNLVTTKGSRSVISLIIQTPADLDDDLQGVLDLIAINGITQPVTHFVTDPLITDTKTYTAKVSDGVNDIIVSDTINFYYPFLYGPSASTSITHYSALTKLIEGKANKSFLFNATDSYFWIGYPASYGNLARIRDANGFDVTDAFTASTVNVTSIGLDANWTVSYKFYRTTLITDIVNQSYSIEF